MNTAICDGLRGVRRARKARWLLGWWMLLAAAGCAGREVDPQVMWGESGSGDGLFKGIRGVAVNPGGSVYVLDSGNNRVQEFNFRGGFQKKWGSAGSGDGEFNGPSGIAVDKDNGNIFVADTGNSRVEKFDRNGKFLKTWGSSGGGDNQFSNAAAIAVGPDHSVYVVDSIDHVVKKFSEFGDFRVKWKTELPDKRVATGTGIAVNARNEVFVLERTGNSVLKYNASGGFLTSWKTQSTFPYGIAANSLGLVLVTDFTNRDVQVYSDGHYVESISIKAVSPFKNFPYWPQALSFYQDDMIFSTDRATSSVPRVAESRVF